MARLLLSLLGYRFDVELCREADLLTEEDTEEDASDLSGGDLGTYRIGFTTPDPTPYDVDFPDRA